MSLFKSITSFSFSVYQTGVPRTTKEEFDFGNFSLFNDPRQPYSTFKFTYTHEEFDRISKLMEYNTLLNAETIFDNISVCIKRRRKFSIRRPCKSKDIAHLSLNSRGKIEKLQQYIAMAEKLAQEAEMEEKNRALRKLSPIDKLRPISAPVNPDMEEVSDEDEEVKNSRLQRSTVSLRPNMLRHRGVKPSLSDVQEKTEDREDDTVDSSSNKSRKKILTRSKPVSNRPDFDEIDSRFLIIEEEVSEANLGRRSSKDDSELHVQLRKLSSNDKRKARLQMVDKSEAFDNLSLAEIPDLKLVNCDGDRHAKNGDLEKNFTDSSSLQEWLNKADRVTDL